MSAHPLGPHVGKSRPQILNPLKQLKQLNWLKRLNWLNWLKRLN